MLQGIVLANVAAVVFMMGYVVYYGRRVRLSGRDASELESHRRGTTCTLWLMLITIAVLEILLWKHPQPVRPPIFWVHLPLAFSFFGLFLALRFRYTGLRSKTHGRLAYLCIALFAATLGTGTVLFFNLQM